MSLPMEAHGRTPETRVPRPAPPVSEALRQFEVQVPVPVAPAAPAARAPAELFAPGVEEKSSVNAL